MVETLLPQDLTLQTMTLRLGLSLFFGAIVGLEREYRDQPAGFRTHTLICLGTTLLTFVSVALSDWHGSGDPGRVAAQVVSGIGFLGAGAIIKSGADIRGLTTAASIWAVSAIGMGIGAGLYVPSIVAFLLVMLVLTLLNKLEKVLFRQRLVKTVLVVGEGDALKSGVVEELIKSFGMRIRTVDVIYAVSKKRTNLKYIVYAPRMLPIEKFLTAAQKLPGVLRISVDELS